MLELALELPAQIGAQVAPLPQPVRDMLATAQAWATGISIGLGVLGLIFIGIGLFFKHRRGDGGEVLGSLGWWIAGAVLVGGAAGIAAVVIPTS